MKKCSKKNLQRGGAAKLFVEEKQSLKQCCIPKDKVQEQGNPKKTHNLHLKIKNWKMKCSLLKQGPVWLGTFRSFSERNTLSEKDVFHNWQPTFHATKLYLLVSWKHGYFYLKNRSQNDHPINRQTTKIPVENQRTFVGGQAWDTQQMVNMSSKLMIFIDDLFHLQFLIYLKSRSY